MDHSAESRGSVRQEPMGGIVYCVIPVFNRINETLGCIECLKAQTYRDIVVIVADGGSTDGTPEILAREHPDVIVLTSEKELWWGGATRLGVDWALNASKSDADFVMLVNNDTVFGSDYVAKLIRHSQRHDAALVGVVVDADNPERIIDAGVHLDWESYAFKGLYERPSGDAKVKLDSCVLPGRGTLIPITAIRTAGSVNDRLYPHYLSDYEFTYRLRTKAGIRLGVAYDAEILTNVVEPQAPAMRRRLAEVTWRMRDTLALRSKRNMIAHYWMIEHHAPSDLRARLKALLIWRWTRHVFDPIAPPPNALAVKLLHMALRPYHIRESEISKFGLDEKRLAELGIIRPSPFPGFVSPGKPRYFVVKAYPEALVLYRRANNPFRKLSRIAETRWLRLLRPTLRLGSLTQRRGRSGRLR